MLLNYAELVLVVTPSRYNTPCSVSFQQSVYGLPRRRSRQMRRWLVEHFVLVLDPDFDDGYQDDERLERLLLKSVLGQAHTLWAALDRQQDLGVIGATWSKNGSRKREISSAQVKFVLLFRICCTSLVSTSGMTNSWSLCLYHTHFQLPRCRVNI